MTLNKRNLNSRPLGQEEEQEELEVQRHGESFGENRRRCRDDILKSSATPILSTLERRFAAIRLLPLRKKAVSAKPAA